MTPEIAQLIEDLHQPGLSLLERNAVWERYNSIVQLNKT